MDRMLRFTAHTFVLTLLSLVFCLPSCSRSEPPLRHQDPAYKIPAMKAAVSDQDTGAIPMLIDSLDSDDPAVRLYAIIALEKLSGQTFDYAFYADRAERQPSIQRWRQWLAAQRPTTQPAATQG